MVGNSLAACDEKRQEFAKRQQEITGPCQETANHTTLCKTTICQPAN